MSMCIWTGADVYIEEYGGTVHCDVHVFDADTSPVIVINYVGDIEYDVIVDSKTPHVLINDGYHNQTDKVIVVPLSNTAGFHGRL